jgi:uncharacterized phage infection (PIP) family protein YhgE
MIESCKGCYEQKLDIALIQKDLKNIGNLCEKMDITIDKMQEVASNLTRIVYLQEQKSTIQEKINNEVDFKLNELQKDHNKDIDDLNRKITTVNIELMNKIEQSQTKIVAELHTGRQQLHNEINNINTNLNKKIGEIDVWRYMVMGGIALAVWLFANLSGLSKILFH